MSASVLQSSNSSFDPNCAGWGLTVVEQSANFIAICIEGKISYINKSGYELLDADTPESILNTDLIDYVHADYKEFLSFGLDVLAEENDFIPLKFQTVKGVELDVKLLVREIEIGTDKGFVVEAINITEYKKASEAVRDREHRLTSILNTVAEGILTFNENGIVESFNPAAERTFALSSQDVIGQHISILFPDEIADGYTRFLENKIIKKTTPLLGNTWEIKGKNHNNGTFPIELTLSKLRIGTETILTAVFRDITERKNNENRIKHMAHHDSLTGLPNRHLFKDRLNHAINISKRYEKKLVIMFIDLDKFKPINDTLGHEAGDIVLKEVSKRLTSIIRESDTVARIGGDEFVVLLEELDYIETGATVADKILDKLMIPVQVAGKNCKIGASIGISSFPKDSTDLDQLMKCADEAMYAVKVDGRNAFKFYDTSMSVLATY